MKDWEGEFNWAVPPCWSHDVLVLAGDELEAVKFVLVILFVVWVNRELLLVDHQVLKYYLRNYYSRMSFAMVFVLVSLILLLISYVVIVCNWKISLIRLQLWIIGEICITYLLFSVGRK